ncbi:MAG: hypothetical protein KM296_02235 [Brockia lithotrophica]|nr:hypothetical protein [Brockia lithotrophica]
MSMTTYGRKQSAPRARRRRKRPEATRRVAVGPHMSLRRRKTSSAPWRSIFRVSGTKRETKASHCRRGTIHAALPPI